MEGRWDGRAHACEGLHFAFVGSVVFHFLSTGLPIFGLTRYSCLRLASPFSGNHEHMLCAMYNMYVCRYPS